MRENEKLVELRAVGRRRHKEKTQKKMQLRNGKILKPTYRCVCGAKTDIENSKVCEKCITLKNDKCHICRRELNPHIRKWVLQYYHDETATFKYGKESRQSMTLFIDPEMPCLYFQTFKSPLDPDVRIRADYTQWRRTNAASFCETRRVIPVCRECEQICFHGKNKYTTEDGRTLAPLIYIVEYQKLINQQ